MKNGSRSKFLLCFRPVVDMEMVVESKGVVVDRPTRRSRTKPIENTKVEKTKVVEVKEEEEEEVKVQAPLTKTMSLDRECSMISSQSSKMPRSRHNRTFSRVIKAVVFETILAKKVRDGRVVRQDSFGSKRSYSMNRGKSLSLETDELMITPTETNSHEVKVNCSSNPDSAKQSTKNQEDSVTILSKKKKKKDSVTKPKKNEKGSCDLNSGMYLLLISLGITVLWGRVFAILFTSLWLYFFTWSCPTSYRRRPENVRKWSEAESRDQKRRVIMEGLIERNHHFHSSQREH